MVVDLLLKNGYVVDPKNNFEDYYDIAINYGKIDKLYKKGSTVEAREIIDLDGLYACPGIIDAHVHVTSKFAGPSGYKMIAGSGVTSAIDLAGPIEEVLETITKWGSGINFGSCNTVFPDLFDKRKDSNISIITDYVLESLRKGAFGIKILGGLFPLTPEITREVIEVCNKNKIYIAFHAGTTETGSHLGGFREAVKLAEDFRLHVVHMNAYLRGLVKKDPLLELSEALDLLKSNPNIFTDSFFAIINLDSARCINGIPESRGTWNHLKMKGYPATEEGLKDAIINGYASVIKIVPEEGRSLLLKGKEGFDYWIESGTATGISFPVNSPDISFALACARDYDNSFIVDLLITDGGGIPRNITLEKGLSVVKYGGFSLNEFVNKISFLPAQLLGLDNKGHLSEGADADITIFDFKEQQAIHSLVEGKFIMKNKKLIGQGGKIITTQIGVKHLREKGFACCVADLEKSMFYL